MLYFVLPLVFLYLVLTFVGLNFMQKIKHTRQTKIANTNKIKNFVIVQIVLLLIFLLSFAVYYFVGEFKNLTLNAGIEKYLANNQAQTAQDILQAKIATDANNKTAWFLLTKVTPLTQDYDLAIKAYKKIIALQGKNSYLLANLAQVIYLKNGQKADVQTNEILQESLRLDAKNPLALTLLGMQEYQYKNWDKAYNYWVLALNYVADDSLDARVLTSAIKNVETKLVATIQVNLSLATSIQKQLKRHLSFTPKLLVFTKIANNSQPLDVVKLEINQLPTKVALKYPPYEQNLEVFALLSDAKSSDTPQFFGTKKLVRGMKSLDLSINKKVK